MNNIQILDCTLRDGGYCNEWRFGFENAKKITQGLLEANIEIRVGTDSFTQEEKLLYTLMSIKPLVDKNI